METGMSDEQGGEDKAVRLLVEAYQSNKHLYNETPLTRTSLGQNTCPVFSIQGQKKVKKRSGWLYWGKARLHDANITILAKPSTDSSAVIWE